MYEPGTKLAFVDGADDLVGIVNGECRALGADEDTITHVPVYVHEGDRCIMVALSNVTAVIDIADAAIDAADKALS